MLPLLAAAFFADARPATAVSKSPTENQLEKARESYEKLLKSSPQREYRNHWLNTIDLYRLVFETRPEAPEADQAMYMVGTLYRGLYGKSQVPSDLDMALYYFRRLVKAYPGSAMADDSLYALGEILLKDKKEPALAYLEFEQVVDSFPDGDIYKAAAAMVSTLSKYHSDTCPAPSLPPSTGKLAQVTSIRHWSNPSYTRVVVDVDQPVKFNPNFIRDEADASRPKLYIDLFNTTLGRRLAKPMPIADGLLLRSRAGQFTLDTVRVVLDMARITEYRVFSLADPFRIVVDISGYGRQRLQVMKDDAPAAPGLPNPGVPAVPPANPWATTASRTDKALTLAQQLGLSVKRVVIDPGHGGQDPGAIGVDGLQEKDITLDLSLRLKKALEERYGLEVVMTRDSDVFLPLEERTALANTSKADLFISVHCNASRKKLLRGVETYFLNLASSREAAETAAVENMTSVARIADFEKTMVDLFMTMKIDESSRFAQIVQDELYTSLRKKYKDVVNLGVKQAPFVVLIGAQMPSILAEVSFINHAVEGKRLAQEDYRQQVAEALAQGLGSYVSTVSLVSSH